MRYRPGRIAGDGVSRGYVFGDHGAGSDNGIFADGHAAQDRRPAPDAGAALHHGGDRFPIIIGLQLACAGGGARNFIVDKDNPVTDKNLVLNLDALADEGVAGNFAATADAGPPLNFDERADPAFIADFAAVKIYKVVNNDVVAKLYVRRN